MRAVIFANGNLEYPLEAQAAIQPGDLVIAADGGAHHCQTIGISPAIVVGDLDSLNAGILEHLQASGTDIFRYPARKDYTDLELALQLAVERGVDVILVFGALGARWDQTLANLLLPASAAFRGVQIRLEDGPQEIILALSNQINRLDGKPGDTVSLIPLGGDTEGITTQGLEYPLEDETLFFGSTRGISNVLLDENATVFIKKGLLLCIIIHNTISNSKEV